MRFETIRKPEYTDLALFVGPHERGTKEDYEDLQRYKPEVLLGYRVHLMAAEWVVRGQHLGLHPEKVVVTYVPGHYDWDLWDRVYQTLRGAVATGHFPHFEVWHIHRGRGIWRVE